MISEEENLLSKAEKTIKKGTKSKSPKLIVLMGLPGSGKSYVSNYLHEKYGLTVLSGENITFALFNKVNCTGVEYSLAYDILLQLTTELISQGYSIVIDGTNLKFIYRQQIYNDVSCPDTTLLYLKVDYKTALNRISQRGVDFDDSKNIKSSISPDIFNKFKNQLEEPLPSENSITLISDDNLLTKINSIFSTIYTWIPTSNIDKYQPITQVYGVCVNNNNEVLICREPQHLEWGLPGGTPEGNETPIKTLERELMEEVDITVTNIEPIGIQRVDFPNNSNKHEGDLFYQVRYFCKIKELLPQTLDPDTGLLYDRKFISISELNNYLKWGKIGDIIVAKAIEINKKI